MNNKIFFVVSRMHGGGAQRVMVHLLNYLVEYTQVDVKLILFNSKPGDAYLPLISKKCKIEVLHTSAKYGWLKLAKIIRRENPDVLFSTLNYINISSIFATLFSRSKLRLVVREARPISKTQSFIRLIQKVLYWRVDLFWAITPIIADELASYLNIEPTKIKLAPNPIDVKRELFTVNKPNESSIFKLLYVGRLIALKNVDLMITALSFIKDKQWQFKIVGTGPLEKQLKKMVLDLGLTDKVEFVGYSNDPYSFMLESDILLLASKFEGFPNVLVEALACGNLCIANDTEGGGVQYIKTIVDDLIIENFEEPQLISDIISSYMDNPQELQRIKKMGKEKASSLQIENYFNEYMKDILL